MPWVRTVTKGFPTPPPEGGCFWLRIGHHFHHEPGCHLLLHGHELSKATHGAGPAEILWAWAIGGSSAITTIRPAPQQGQTRVGVTLDSHRGGEVGSVGVVSA